jgi:uncharacterized protein YdaT
MPWSAESFKRKHWSKASPNQARKAAEIANRMLSEGADEGIAIATGIKRAKGRSLRFMMKRRKK